MRLLILLGILLAHSSVNADAWRPPYNRMNTLYRQGDYRAALPHAEEALRLSSQEFGERHATTVILLANVGLLHNKLGDNEKAASFLRRSVEAEMSVSGADDPKVAKGLMDLGRVYEELGDYGLAEIVFTHALAIYRSTLGDNAPETKRASRFFERVSQKQLLAHAAQTKPPLSTSAIVPSRAQQPSTPEALQKPQPLPYEDGQVRNDAISQQDTSGEYTPTQRAVAFTLLVLGLGSLCLRFCAPSAFGSAATHLVVAFRSIRRKFAAAMEARARANAEKQKLIDKQLEEMRAIQAEEQRLQQENQKKMAQELAAIEKEAAFTTPAEPKLDIPAVEWNRSGWLAAFLIACLLGVLGSAAGSGDSLPGFGVALALNPVLWFAGFAGYRMRLITCPHCQAPLKNKRQFLNAAIGSIGKCVRCRNAVRKSAR